MLVPYRFSFKVIFLLDACSFHRYRGPPLSRREAGEKTPHIFVENHLREASGESTKVFVEKTRRGLMGNKATRDLVENTRRGKKSQRGGAGGGNQRERGLLCLDIIFSTVITSIGRPCF